MSEIRLAWFTPLQPVESGVSLYSEDILPLLSTSMTIDVFIDRYSPTNIVASDRLAIRRATDFRPDNYDLVVYQMGNSPAHLYMLDEAARTPGLLVLHDAVLNHLYVQQAARHGRLGEYRDEMTRRYGEAGSRAAERVLKGQAPDDLFTFPMSESLVDSSLLTIVHSEYARQQVLEWCPKSEVVRVPHGLRMPELVDRSSARQELGIPSDQFVIASITHISPYKRLDVVLRAFRQLRNTVPARLILAGSVSPNYPIERTVTHLGLDQVVDLPGYVTDEHARLIAAAADVIVNLRYPTAGETSGSLLHSMAAGRPVLVSRTGSFTEVPPDAVIPVPVDALEEDMLVAIFSRLAADPRLGEQIGARARAFVAREHSIQRWVDGYAAAIGRLTGHSLAVPTVEIPEEPVVGAWNADTPCEPDSVIDEISLDIAELGLGGDEDLLHDVARSAVEIGLGIGKMRHDSDAER